MSKVYLKTYFYVEHEVKFLAMNLLEAYDHIDGFIICEHNRTHTGRPRDYIWDEVKGQLPAEFMDKVIYLPSDLSDKAVEAYEREDLIHSINEPVMRSSFMTDMQFDRDDIIISIDADEIIYRNAYPQILETVDRQNLVRLNLHQFFYKTNYLWEGKDFTAPIASKYWVFQDHYPTNWRDTGPIMPGKHGCHFSWCMTPEEMVYKLHTYSHPRYRFCANKELLEEAIANKEYPFDPDVDFRIRELDNNDEVIPECLRNQLQYLEKALA